MMGRDSARQCILAGNEVLCQVSYILHILRFIIRDPPSLLNSREDDDKSDYEFEDSPISENHKYVGQCMQLAGITDEYINLRSVPILCNEVDIYCSSICSGISAVLCYCMLVCKHKA